MDMSKIPEDIRSVIDRIVEKFHPEKIYLFSNKRAGVGKSAGFKLCVILECDNMAEVERQIYVDIDSEVPYDIVLYSPDIFEEVCGRESSFAKKIATNGVLVYG